MSIISLATLVFARMGHKLTLSGPTPSANSIPGESLTQAPLCNVFTRALILESTGILLSIQFYVTISRTRYFKEAGGKYFMYNDVSNTIYRIDTTNRAMFGGLMGRALPW